MPEDSDQATEARCGLGVTEVAARFRSAPSPACNLGDPEAAGKENQILSPGDGTLSIQECARLAIENWGPEEAPTMVAIAGAESGWNPAATGDHLSLFSPAQQTAYAPFACHENLSHGYWQIFLGVHTPMIRSMSQLDSPCELADWLHIGTNNARAAAAIKANAGGNNPWSTYNNGGYEQFMEQAREAVLNEIQLPFLNPSLPPPPERFDYARLGQMFRALGDAIEGMNPER